MRGNFFAVDRHMWPKAVDLGLNPAVAYLVLACGTGADQSTTAWSTNAVETYTSISRQRAKQAIARLLDSKLVRLGKASTRPRYDILHSTKEPEWLWLPNEFVIGAGTEKPPLELLRQTQEPMALRLAVDLYGAQNLAEDGGISRGTIYQSYSRYEPLGQWGQYTVWGFRRSSHWVTWNDITKPHRREKLTEEEKKAGENPAVDFWPRLELLSRTGIIEWVACLCESEKADAEIIHPLCVDSDHPQHPRLETRIGSAARAAAIAMLRADRRETPEIYANLHLVPVPHHVANVACVGIARLRYRPKTAMTAAWWGNDQEAGEAWIRKYEQLQAEIISAVRATA